MISDNKKELIAIQVIRTLFSRFQSFPEDTSNNRNAPFHEAFLHAFSDKLRGHVSDLPFFISLSSWLHGLNTTLGQSFFENVAHILSDGDKMEFTKRRSRGSRISRSVKSKIADIITDLKNGDQRPDLDAENSVIFGDEEATDLEANNFTVDVFIEDLSTINAIELKTVKPNAGEMRGEKQKILEAKAALKYKYPDKQINFYIGFPFDPTNDTALGYDKTRFLNSIIDGSKYFDENEVLLADELWDFLSGESGTMGELLNIINVIATPEFLDKFNILNESINFVSKSNEYNTIINDWLLIREQDLFNNLREIRELRKSAIFAQRHIKAMLKPPFNNKIEYDERRFKNLKELIP